MSRFEAVLREISGRVNLPQPARTRVLAEIAGDLDDFFQAFLERGASEEDAERQALGHIDLSDEALRDLARVHGNWFRRLSDSIAERAGSRWELTLVGLLVLLAVFLSGAVVQAVPICRAAGAWLIPVACAAVATLGIGAWKAHVLWLRGDHRPKGLHAGLGAMLGLSVLQLFLAFAGVWVTAWAALRAVGLEPAQAGITTMHWLLGALALLVMGMSLALVCGLAWFILLGKVASIERAEAAALLPD
ncbi:MAG: hypothetical protein LJF06_18915 [Gemmatimonadetes bacterium]|jgi:hypothetical protein|nr:hypothetical protein [Gemmatimonadota bacterium]